MEALTPGSKIVATVFFLAWNLYYGALIHTPYPRALVSLYIYPFWRLLLVLLLVSAVAWSPRVGMMVSFAVFFYLMDMPHLISP